MSDSSWVLWFDIWWVLVGCILFFLVRFHSHFVTSVVFIFLLVLLQFLKVIREIHKVILEIIFISFKTFKLPILILFWH